MGQKKPKISPSQLGMMSRKAGSIMQRRQRLPPRSSGSKKGAGQESDKRVGNSNNNKASERGAVATLPKIDKRTGGLKRLDMHGRERKSTPSSDPLCYSSSTLPRPKSQNEDIGEKKNSANLRWVVDSREQLEHVASRRNELESRGTIAKRM